MPLRTHHFLLPHPAYSAGRDATSFILAMNTWYLTSCSRQTRVASPQRRPLRSEQEAPSRQTLIDVDYLFAVWRKSYCLDLNEVLNARRMSYKFPAAVPRYTWR